MTDAVIINAAERFGKKPAAPLPGSEKWAAPHAMSLPIASVKRKNEYGWPQSFWTDTPTGDVLADRKRGEQYAMGALGAILTDGRHIGGRVLAVIFEDIILDAVKRRAKGGKGSRKLPAAGRAFVQVLGDFITTKRHAEGPDNAA
jgi:hypothetical protein